MLMLFSFFVHRQDSVVSDRINYDLLKKIKSLQNDEFACPELLGNESQTKSRECLPRAIQKRLCSHN